jgi:hypothetical protein
MASMQQRRKNSVRSRTRVWAKQRRKSQDTLTVIEAVNMLATKLQSFEIEPSQTPALGDDAPLWAVAANSEGAKAKERTNILSDLFKEHDPHHDGTCDLRGFIAGIKALDNMIGLSEISSERLGGKVLESIFRKFDASHSGFVVYKVCCRFIPVELQAH